MFRTKPLTLKNVRFDLDQHLIRWVSYETKKGVHLDRISAQPFERAEKTLVGELQDVGNSHPQQASWLRSES